MSRIKRDLSMTRIGQQEPSSVEGDLNMLRRVLPRGAKSSICVIGAGVAGLRCADFLLQKGFNVTIFEARDRFGGRVRLSVNTAVDSVLIPRSFGNLESKGTL